MIGARELYTMCGHVSTSVNGVYTVTSNVAGLVAVAHALSWAKHHHLAAGHDICIRYASEYPAYIASRVWKARKHKDMAAKAQRLWSQLRRLKHDNVWIHHTPAREPRAAQAAGLACRGMRGERINAATID